VNRNSRSHQLLYVLASLLCLGFVNCADAQTPYHFQPGIRISKTRPPTNRQVSGLIHELAFLSGLNLKVNLNGTIRYDKLDSSGGSAIARALLMTAIDGPDSFSVESANHSPQVAFAQIESILDYTNGNRRATEWVIRIDFADFAQLRGDAPVLKAFSPGTNLLHEFIHAVLNLPDPEGPGDRLGLCERYLNHIRAELGLPLRQNYFPKNRIARSPESLSQILLAELNFTHGDSNKSKETKDSSLVFNIAMVVDAERVKSNMSILCDLVALSRRPVIQKR
jgi:hypothetical protein